jgi:hypothetical protein
MMDEYTGNEGILDIHLPYSQQSSQLGGLATSVELKNTVHGFPVKFSFVLDSSAVWQSSEVNSFEQWFEIREEILKTGSILRKSREQQSRWRHMTW